LAALAILGTLRIAYTYANTAACERTAPRLRYIIATLSRPSEKRLSVSRGAHAEAANPFPLARRRHRRPRVRGPPPRGRGEGASSFFARAEKNSGPSSAIRAALHRRSGAPPRPSPSSPLSSWSPSPSLHPPNQTLARGFQRATGLMAIMHF